jgi:hypothetical protein
MLIVVVTLITSLLISSLAFHDILFASEKNEFTCCG